MRFALLGAILWATGLAAQTDVEFDVHLTDVMTEVGNPAARVEIRNLTSTPVVIQEVRLNDGQRPQWRGVWCRLPAWFGFMSSGLEGTPISKATCDQMYSDAAQDAHDIGMERYVTPDESYAVAPGGQTTFLFEWVKSDQIDEVAIVTGGGTTRVRVE